MDQNRDILGDIPGICRAYPCAAWGMRFLKSLQPYPGNDGTNLESYERRGKTKCVSDCHATLSPKYCFESKMWSQTIYSYRQVSADLVARSTKFLVDVNRIQQEAERIKGEGQERSFGSTFCHSIGEFVGLVNKYQEKNKKELKKYIQTYREEKSGVKPTETKILTEEDNHMIRLKQWLNRKQK